MSDEVLDLKMFIDGEWLDTTGRRSEPVINPATGASLGDLPHATTDDLQRAIDTSQAAFQRWRIMSPLARGEILRKAAQLFRERGDRIARIMSLEQGKTLTESRIEVMVTAEMLEWAAEEGRRTYGRVIPPRENGWRQIVVQEPIGVTAAFTPWNFPAMIPARKIASSLAAGCTCIIKPSEETPACAIEIARALQDAGLPKGVLNVVFGVPADVSEFLIASPIVRKVSFTGSVAVGKHIAGLAARGVKPVTLELGGHAPVLVFDDVNVDAVARMAAAGKYRNAGQVCISPTRFFVHRKVHDAFVDLFGRAAGALRVGPGVEASSQMGALANPRRLTAMDTLVEDARSRGASVVTGGERMSGDGYFFRPTVLASLHADSRVLSEEPFGPLAMVVPFDDDEEALRQANHLPYGLAAYAFTSNADRIIKVSNGIESGMVGMNTFAIASAESPFGGVKDSGYGSEGGIEGVAAYLTPKFISQSPAP